MNEGPVIHKRSHCVGALHSLGSSCLVLSELLEPANEIEKVTVCEKGLVSWDRLQGLLRQISDSGLCKLYMTKQ